MDFTLGERLSAMFWRDEYWLPVGVKWADIHPDDGLMYPNETDIWTYPIIFAFFMIMFRSWILNPFVLEPFAMAMGLEVKKVKPPKPNPILEKVFLANKGCVPSKAIEETSASLQLTRRQVECWLRSRAAMTKLTKLDKFQDSAYICIYHSLITAYGFTIMYSKPWLWDISLIYRNFPYHDIDTGIWWYYMIGSAFYWSQSIWQFKFSHGKDAKILYLHHICTILLLGCSWTCNFIRIGTLILLVHECGDIPLQILKILRYLKEKVWIDYMHVSFAILWVTTRMGIYPFWILHCIFIEMPKHVDVPTVSILNIFLLILFFLNIIWTGCVFYSLYKRVATGYMENVVSSGNEDSERESGSTLEAKDK